MVGNTLRKPTAQNLAPLARRSDPGRRLDDLPDQTGPFTRTERSDHPVVRPIALDCLAVGLTKEPGGLDPSCRVPPYETLRHHRTGTRASRP
jgi:hypothetical protein